MSRIWEINGLSLELDMEDYETSKNYMKAFEEMSEEEKQVKMLKRLGCDYIQGYYFAKPMPKKDYVKLLQKSR